jgi:hypothetical protein
MDDIIEFRHNAEECRALAARASTAVLRAELLELANQWSMLAAEHERCLNEAQGVRIWLH